MSEQDKIQRSNLPIPDQPHVGLMTYDAKDPDTHYPPIKELRPPRQSIEAFVQRVTTAGGKDFVPAAECIAVFDNDGTLWPEYPLVGQLAFILDELKRRGAAGPS